jgi:Dockerin type I domain/PEP-CTERM motif
MSSRNVTHRNVIANCAAGMTVLALMAMAADSASAQIARQRATFTIDGTTVLGVQGFTTGFLNDSDPTTKVLNAALSAQDVNSFEVGYSGTVTADISFDSVTKAITGIHIADANLVAGNSGDWKPGNWNGSTFGDGQTKETANYGGSVANVIVFATRSATLSIKNQGAVFAVAPGGDFAVTTAQKVQFTGGNLGLFANGLVDGNDPLTSYNNYESDTLATQPATFTYLDDMGMPQVLANPQAGQLYPSTLVWRYVLSNEDRPVFDAQGNPVYNTPGNPASGQKTENVRTYGDLAPAFEGTKGGLQTAGTVPLDEDWYHPHDGAVGKPDVQRLYTPSTTEFDSMGNPMPIWGQLEMKNTGMNYSDGAGTVPVSSNISATLNGGTGKYDASLAMNMSATAPFFVGDFSVSLILGQAKSVIFGNLEPGTGRLFADAALSLKAGDVNNDGVVNIFDINMVSSNWSPKPNPDLYAGDANNDGVVNIFDINLISANWSPAAATAVPEPSTLLLAAIGGMAVFLGYRRRRR